MNTLKRSIQWMAISLIALTVLTGCAIETGYVTATDLADELGLTVRYDRAADRVVMTGGGDTVIASPGTDRVLVNGQLIRLGKSVVYNGAEVHFPASAKSKLQRLLNQ